MLKRSVFTLMLAAMAASGDIRADQNQQPVWSYECESIDKLTALGQTKELLTFVSVVAGRGRSYAITVYRAGGRAMSGYYRVRAIGYKHVRKPGCYELQIERSAMDRYVAELVKQEEMPDRARLGMSKWGDGLTSVIALRHPDDSVTYYLGYEMGQKLLELTDAAQFFRSAKE